MIPGLRRRDVCMYSARFFTRTYLLCFMRDAAKTEVKNAAFFFFCFFNASKNSFGGTCRSRMRGDGKVQHRRRREWIQGWSSFKFKSQPSSLKPFHEIYSPACEIIAKTERDFIPTSGVEKLTNLTFRCE